LRRTADGLGQRITVVTGFCNPIELELLLSPFKLRNRMPPRDPWQKVGECLYRYAPTGGFYGLLKSHGKQVRRSLKTKDRTLAVRRLADLRKELDRLEPGAGQTPFTAVAQEWLDSHRHALAKSTARRKTQYLAVLSPHFEKPVSRISRTDVESWVKKRVAKASASTFNHELECLKGILERAVDLGMITRNPAAGVPRKKGEKRSERGVLAPEELDRLLATLRSTHADSEAPDFVELICLSGCRPGEVSALDWAHVDFKGGWLKVPGTKSGAAVRRVPLGQRLRSFLHGMRTRQAGRAGEKLFSIRTPRKALQTACRALGIAYINPHRFRHQFISQAVMAGVDFRTIAQWVGHSDGGVLIGKVYGHITDEHSRQMMERL